MKIEFIYTYYKKMAKVTLTFDDCDLDAGMDVLLKVRKANVDGDSAVVKKATIITTDDEPVEYDCTCVRCQCRKKAGFKSDSVHTNFITLDKIKKFQSMETNVLENRLKSNIKLMFGQCVEKTKEVLSYIDLHVCLYTAFYQNYRYDMPELEGFRLSYGELIPINLYTMPDRDYKLFMKVIESNEKLTNVVTTIRDGKMNDIITVGRKCNDIYVHSL